MWLDLLDDEKKKIILDQIHESVAKKCGFRRNDYAFHIDPSMDNEIEWIAGPSIQITIRYTPLHPLFVLITKRAFNPNFDIGDLFRSKALVRQVDFDRWHRIGIRGVFFKQEKKKSLRRTNFSLVTKIIAQDIKTKRKVEVEIFNSNAFEAQERALKILYGD